MTRKRATRAMTLAVAALAAAAAGVVAMTAMKLEKLAPTLSTELEATERRAAKISRELDQAKQRAELHAWMQEQMRLRNPRLSEAATAHYSDLLLEVTDRYAGVDPLFLLAVGIVESRFETTATSHANARGLYQIWPPTGRWLAEELGWEYSDAMLHVPEKNTELAACYLERLFATYGDPELVLAEYNGGPRNARRLRRGSADVARETQDYVVKVMVTFERLAADLPTIEREPLSDG